MQRHHGFGLRAQIVLALTAAFVLSFTGLGIIVMQVTKKAQELENERHTQAALEALAVALTSSELTSPSPETLARLVGRADITGLSLSARLGQPVRLGQIDGTPTASTLLPNGERLSVWTLAVDSAPTGALGRLLRLYLLMTGTVILMVAYAALTRLIVRPVEDLTRASEKLAEGALSSQVPVAGAAEVARLAVSFNRMASELRRDRSALENRLRELERTTAELRNTQDQLIRSEKLASVGRLAAGVAHEIGNPLAAILGLVELMQMGGLEPGEQREFLSRVRSETERIHHIIRDLLDYSRTRPETQQLDVSASLVEVVEEAVKLVSPQKDLRRINIERQLGDVPHVRASAHELTQIILNLLLNATDAVAGEGTILIEVAEEGEMVRLSVSDSGPGIPEHVRDKLFEPFVTTKPAGEGTGLGLAVCQALTERLGGSIKAENRARAGARFTVLIPVYASREPKSQTAD